MLLGRKVLNNYIKVTAMKKLSSLCNFPVSCFGTGRATLDAKHYDCRSWNLKLYGSKLKERFFEDYLSNAKQVVN